MNKFESVSRRRFMKNAAAIGAGLWVAGRTKQSHATDPIFETDWRLPTRTAGDGSGSPWWNTGNLVDLPYYPDAYADNVTKKETTAGIYGWRYQFGIPANFTLLGIKVRALRNSGNQKVFDGQVHCFAGVQNFGGDGSAPGTTGGCTGPGDLGTMNYAGQGIVHCGSPPYYESFWKTTPCEVEYPGDGTLSLWGIEHFMQSPQYIQDPSLFLDEVLGVRIQGEGNHSTTSVYFHSLRMKLIYSLPA